MESEIKDILVKLLEGQTRLETEVKKNSIQLEKIQTDIKTLAEVQKSFSEQLDRSKNKDGKTLGERLDIIELAISTTSESSKKNFDNLNNKIDDLQIDVNTLISKIMKTDTKVIQFERLLADKKQG